MFQLDGVHVITVEGLKAAADAETCTFAGDSVAAKESFAERRFRNAI